MKHSVLRIFYSVCAWLGVFRLFYAINRNKTVNITYHNILPDDIFDDSIHLGVSHPASVFEAQIIHISKRFSISTDDPEGKGTCRITFDDGYLNQKDIAANILEKHGLNGVFFVPFEPLESGKTLAVDKILQWISYVPSGTHHIFGLNLIVLDRDRASAFQTLYNYLLANAEQWHPLVAELDKVYSFSRLKVAPELVRLRFTPLSVQDLKEMRSSGHRIGCHGWDHRPMATLAPQTVTDELTRCWEKLGGYCNCEEFSYPFGGVTAVSPAVAAACQKAGFSHALMNTSVIPDQFANLSRYAITRLSLSRSCSPHVLDAKLSGFENFLKRRLHLP
jgi:peptidoglycan/xylan/chitin deacetylase (PgdA/CDA1 family)